MPGEEEQHSSLGPALSSGAHVSIAPDRPCMAAKQCVLWSPVAQGSQAALLMFCCIWQHPQNRKKSVTLQLPELLWPRQQIFLFICTFPEISWCSHGVQGTLYIIKGKVLDMETASEVQNMEQEIWGMEEEVHAWY